MRKVLLLQQIRDISSRILGSALPILHVPGLGFDGLVGYSPIAMAKNAIGLAIGAWTDSYIEKYCNPRCLIACNLEDIIGKATSTEVLINILGWRIKYGKKTVLVGIEKNGRYSVDLLAVLKQLKTVHVGYARGEEEFSE